MGHAGYAWQNCREGVKVAEDERLKEAANELVDVTAALVAAQAHDAAGIRTVLKDLKLRVAEKGAALADFAADNPDAFDVVWKCGEAMPDFQLQTSGERRMSAVSLASAVLLGWLAGGLLSGLLNLLNLGGDILRAAAIFLTVWLSDYLGANARARTKLLKIFGWTVLGGIATRFAAGIMRLGAGWRSLLPAGMKPGFFRSAWLLLGIAVIFVFFSGKQVKPGKSFDRAALREELVQRLRFLTAIFSILKTWRGELARKTAAIEDASGNTASQAALLNAILEIMPSLPENPRAFLEEKLEKAGIRQQGPEESFFIWDPERDSGLYEVLGIIGQGDKCIAIRRPVEKDGAIVKGLAQRFG